MKTVNQCFAHRRQRAGHFKVSQTKNWTVNLQGEDEMAKQAKKVRMEKWTFVVMTGL